MKCEQMAEFISALCDGEGIPREAAEHIGECEACRARLNEYSTIGAELRRVASLEPMGEARMRDWERTERTSRNWWWKGWETIRIPRLIFALLLATIVVLGSSLAIVKVRAHTHGTVLMLTAKLPDGKNVRCSLSLEDKKFARCAWMALDRVYAFRVIADEVDHVQLGMRIGHSADLAGTGALTDDNVDRLPERQYSFQPGGKLEIPLAWAGTMVITGELMDHMPSLISNDPSEQVDPKPDELRFVSPVLLRDRQVVFDFAGATAIASEKREVIEFYVPEAGLFHIALSPLEGAVQGRITMSRISFELDGQSYMFLLAAPVARGEHIWILHDSSYKPSEGAHQGAFMGTSDESHRLGKPPQC